MGSRYFKKDCNERLNHEAKNGQTFWKGELQSEFATLPNEYLLVQSQQ